MDVPVGGGFLAVVKKPHFWKVLVIFVLLIAGIRAWHYYKIRHDVINTTVADFNAQQTLPVAP